MKEETVPGNVQATNLVFPESQAEADYVKEIPPFGRLATEYWTKNLVFEALAGVEENLSGITESSDLSSIAGAVEFISRTLISLRKAVN